MSGNNKLTKVLLAILIVTNLVYSADQNPQERQHKLPALARQSAVLYEDNFKWHKIGTLWNRVTNFSYMGDDAYNDRTPSCDYPGISANSYLYRGTIWLSAWVDGQYHCTKGEDHEFASLDSVHVITGPGAISEEDTYTRYTDVVAPNADDHFPLGVEIVERTYAWSQSYADDFMIYEYIIKNVGIDTDDDYLPDSARALDNFYFTIRFDGDVSKLPDWGTEDPIACFDDHVISNGVDWSWVEKFPDMAGRDHGLTADMLDSTMVIMFDGDHPTTSADNGDPNDFGNPGVDGVLQTPGFIGIKVLKSEPYMAPYSFHVCHIYNDPVTEAETWKFLKDPVFEEILVDPTNDVPVPYDYRGIITFGPLTTFAPGDSIVITTALGVGSDPDSGGVYSLKELMKHMDVAQFLVDYDYSLSAEALSPPAPMVTLEPILEDGSTTAISVQWDTTALAHPNFYCYYTWKGMKNALGSINWEPLGEGTYQIDDNDSWPPPPGDPGHFKLVGTEIINGMVYYFSVQAATDTIMEPIPFGVISTNIMNENSLQAISPSNPVADNLNRIRVVPNPYIGSVYWNNKRPGDSSPWEHRIQFTNLPEDAMIKLFTLDGDYVDQFKVNRTVIVGGDEDTSSPSVAEWDLMTHNDQIAAPGIYIYVVDSKKYGQKVGKFVIIR